MCQCDLTTQPFSFKMNISTGPTTTPQVDGGQNSETYWVGGSNIYRITRDKYIQAWKPNDSRSA